MFSITHAMDLGDNGGETILFADLNGDGERELVVRQSSEIYGSRQNRRPEFKENISDENAHLFQLCALDWNGKLLWRTGSPWPHPTPYTAHGGTEMTRIVDADRDGKPEVLYLYRDTLVVLDAATGKVRRSVSLPTDALNIVHVQNLGADGYRYLLKSNSFSEWGYGQPLIVLDEEFRQIGEPRVVPGGGHNILLRDVDGDGKDEIFVGYTLLDHDYREMYAFDFGAHADSIYVRDINEDGTDEVIYNCDNERFVCVNVKGELLFEKTEFAHPQAAHIGKFMPEVPGLQIFMNNRGTHGGSFMMDCTGRVLWDFPCNGYSSLFKNPEPGGPDLMLHRPNPGRLAWNPELERSVMERARELGYGEMPIAKGSPHEPFVMDGHGRILYRFPSLAELDLSRWGLPHAQHPATPPGYTIYTLDVDDCGKEELVFHNRYRMWVFS